MARKIVLEVPEGCTIADSALKELVSGALDHEADREREQAMEAERFGDDGTPNRTRAEVLEDMASSTEVR